MKVTKKQVEQFVIGDNLVLGREQANALYDALGEQLGKPRVEYRGCGERMSHGQHVETGKDGTLYVCTGRRFDAT